MRVNGAEHLPAGAAIVAANHVSALDGPLLAVAIARTARRMTRFLVAAEFFRRRRTGWALRLYRQIPLRRGAGDAAALDEAIATVRSGALAGIFPEGRVNPAPDAGLQRGHRGAARIALATGAPVIPVGVWGTQARWPPRGVRWHRPFRPSAAIALGPPLRLHGSVESIEDVDRGTREIMAAIEGQTRTARALAAARA
jgi:1-acyl-sn-glycerol-3-phosphate acyltransferase